MTDFRSDTGDAADAFFEAAQKRKRIAAYAVFALIVAFIVLATLPWLKLP